MIVRRTSASAVAVMATTLLVATLLVGVASVGASTSGRAQPAPDGLPDFYAVPSKIPSRPGALIKSEKVKAPEIDGTVYRVMYVSESETGKPVPVTGIVAIPDGDAPRGGFPVLGLAHGTTGMADECAPSLDPADSPETTNAVLQRGYAIAATDYQGLGTPGLHPYIAGKTAARNTIDNVRAARELADGDLGKDYVVWGHSQGGHTAMHADQLGPEYAPELELHGVVAGAPPSQFNLIYDFLKTSDFRHYLLMAAGGLNQAYGDKAAPLDEVLTPEGIDLIPELEKGCSGDLQDQLAGVDFDTVTNADPFEVPAWNEILTAEDPQSFDTPSDVPLLIIHGGNDEQIPTASSAILSEHLCGIDQSLVRWVYPGTSHAGVIVPSLGDMLTWIDHRFADEPNPDQYAPTGQPDVEITRC
jgi:pimeloyl-ACP methyl ester carboxylesterase